MRVLSSFCLLGVYGGVVALAASDSSSSTNRTLDQTPTWAVASVCVIIIIISICLEKLLHRVGKWLTDRRKRALFEALEKIKAELMILGFISLLLTFGQTYFVKICIPKSAADTMLPCKNQYAKEDDNSGKERRRRLLWSDHRFLAGAETTTNCKEGHVPLISVQGLHQLHILLFFLAFFHVLYSFITVMLSRLKTRSWKRWEEETLSHDYEFSNDPSRFRLTHETSFVRAHTSFWTKIPAFFYIGCFFRQFFRSVSRSDYLTVRNGFITVHLAPGTKFNFRKYIKRSMEDEFKVLVGVSPALWASFVIFLLLNVHGWQALFWASLIPWIIILAVGTKLQVILTRVAMEISDKHAVVQGMPLVQGSDKYFWFGRPQLLLHLLHFALFQNAFQITYFLWIWYSFGLNSCFHEKFSLVIIKEALGVGAIFLCSYITVPLYALVTQMGTQMKKSVFDEQTSKALKKWHMAVKKRHKKDKSSRTLGAGVSPSPSTLSSPAHTLQRFKTTGHSTRSYTYEDSENSDMESELLSPTSSTNHLMIQVDDDNKAHQDQATVMTEPRHEAETSNEDDFSFVKPAPAKEP